MIEVTNKIILIVIIVSIILGIVLGNSIGIIISEHYNQTDSDTISKYEYDERHVVPISTGDSQTFIVT